MLLLRADVQRPDLGLRRSSLQQRRATSRSFSTRRAPRLQRVPEPRESQGGGRADPELAPVMTTNLFAS